MPLEISVRARRDLDELHLYGINTYGPARADAYLAEMFKKFDLIAQWPFAAQERLNMQPPIRLRRQRAHNILYTVENGMVVVLRVLHNSVNWIDLLSE